MHLDSFECASILVEISDMLLRFQISCQNFSFWYAMTHSNVFFECILTHLNVRVFLLSLQICCLNFRYVVKISDMLSKFLTLIRHDSFKCLLDSFEYANILVELADMLFKFQISS